MRGWGSTILKPRPSVPKPVISGAQQRSTGARFASDRRETLELGMTGEEAADNIE
jgi:hypothetical protein